MKHFKVVLSLLTALLLVVVLLLRLIRPQTPQISPLQYATVDGWVVVVNSLSSLGKGLADASKNKSLGEFLSILGKSTSDELFVALKNQLGFDLRDENSIREAGIDDATPSFVSGNFSNKGRTIIQFIAIPVKDEGTIHEWFSGRMAAWKGLKSASDKIEIIPGVWATSFQDEHSTALSQSAPVAALKDGYLFVSPDADSLKKAFELPRDKSVEVSADFQKAMRQLPKSTVSAFQGFPALAVAMGGHLENSNAHVAALFLEPSAAAKSQQHISTFKIALPLFSKAPAPLSVTGKLDPQAPIHLETGIVPSEAIAALSVFIPEFTHTLDARLKKASLSLKDIADIFAPGAAVSVAPVPSGKIVSLLSNPSQWRPTAILRALHVETVAALQDTSKAASLLDKASHLAVAGGLHVQRYDETGELLDNGPDTISAVLSSAAALFGFEAKIRTKEASEDGEKKPSTEAKQANEWAFQFRNGLRISAAIRENHLLVALGDPEFFNALKNRPLPNEVGEKAGANNGSMASLNVDRAVASIRAFPDSAYGIGGFAIKGALDRWLNAFSGVDEMVIGLHREDDVALLDATLRLNAENNDSSQPSAKGSHP